jgi:uncharacterized membrane protein
MYANFLRRLLVYFAWTFVIVFSVYFYYHDVSKYVNHDISARKQAELGWLVLHFVAGACILVLGPIQFWSHGRTRFRQLHRLSGKIYILASLAASTVVFYLLIYYPEKGSVIALGSLAVVWIFATIVAYWFAVNKNFKLHKQFMIRSYVLALAFVFNRYLPIINDHTGIFNFITDDEMKDVTYDWIGWVYPLIITEFLLNWWPSISKMRENKKSRVLSR